MIYARLYKSVLLVYWGLITLLALIPLPQAQQLFLYSDKILHFFSFLILLFLFDKSFNKPISIVTLVYLFSYGIFLELAQGFTQTRSAEIYDLVANALGLLVYFVFAPKFKNIRRV